MIQDVSQFPISSTPTQTQNRGYHSWPQKTWDKGHWHGLPYNQYLQVEPYHDGTRIIYDPYVGVHSHEYWNGSHYVVGGDGTFHHTVDQFGEFIGGNHAHAVAGHRDKTIAGHERSNVVGDSYSHTKGVSHIASLGGHVHFNPGNSVMAHGGSHMIVALSDDAALGMGHGGGGQNSPNRMLMTKNQVTMASVTANQAYGSQQGSVSYEATQGNMKMNAMAGNMNVNGQQTFINGQTTQINGTSKVVIGSPGGMPCPMTIFQNGITITAANGPKGDVSPVTQVSQGAGTA